MRWMSDTWFRLRAIFAPGRMEREMDEEMAFHLEMEARKHVREGMTPEEAALRAHTDFGGVMREKERARDAWGIGLLQDLTSDVRLALRSLRRSPAFAVVVVLSLAVGIGANTALFTAIHAVWLAPVPGVRDQDRIVDLVPVVRGHEEWLWTYPDFENVRNSESPFESVAAWAERDATVGSEEGGMRARVAYVTSEYFQVLGARPTVGRGFLDSEDGAAGQHPVVVVSHHFWQDRMSGSPDVLGRSLTLDGVPYTVVGLAPERFGGARANSGRVDLWVPLSQHPGAAGNQRVLGNRERASVQVLGRLRPGATMSEAQAAVQTVFARLAAEFPQTNEYRTAKAAGFGRFPAQNRMADLIGVVGFCGLFAALLLIICANLAGMALAKSAARGREIAVRLALGSSRARLVRHLMIEAVLLTLVGAGLGVVLALTAMARVSPVDLGIAAPGATFEPSGWAFALCLLLSFAAAQLFGLLPALRFSRPELVTGLKDEAGGGGRSVGRFQRYAASCQTGAAFGLLLMAALFLRSLERANPSRLGFDPAGMGVADFGAGGSFPALLDLSQEGYPSLDERRAVLLDQLLESVASIPGVASVSLSDGFPLDRRRSYLSVRAADRPSAEATDVRVDRTLATEGYFTTIGTPVLQGRAILRSDDRAAPPVAVITRSLADRLWPGQDPLGRQLTRPGAEDPTTWTVVGVVGDVASSSAAETLPHVFLPLRQSDRPDLTIVLRSRADPAALTGPVREALRMVNPRVPVPTLLPAKSLVARATQEQRTSGRVSGLLGLLVLLLSAIGVHGVVALVVTYRTREIAVRIALGATRGVVIRGVLRDGLRMAGPGLLAGGLLAAGTAAAMRSMLLGLSPVDPVSFLSAGVLLLFVVVTSSLGPALRASGIQPMEALRNG